ncbi:phosphopantetheine-binding protein [Streptomyces sp. YU58]|uniref:phosphopantetheine-binding protein n=1 Tax=Streptomyces sp. SX92 TaxID=3158972 RepID=UPI0027BA8470|nr:phosphopantetheine-binding protein [Streptomyces coralus]WLW53085.1 phosphopantetheine-binding protein [Streptomyces coralus]
MIESNLSGEEIEREIRDIWRGLFGVDVGPDDNFFDLGGDSLKVVDVVAAARKRGIGFRSSAVFRNPTPALLAASLTRSDAA